MGQNPAYRPSPSRPIQHGPPEVAFRDRACEDLDLIDQHHRHPVTVASGQVGMGINVHAGEGKGNLGLDRAGEAFDDLAEVALMPGQDRHVHRGRLAAFGAADRQE